MKTFTKTKNRKIIMFAAVAVFLALGKIAFAAMNVSINIPGTGEVSTPPDLINAVYKWSIGFAAVSAFSMIVYHGIVWMMSEAIGNKADARQGIIDAITGLVLLLSAVLIFNTIDPNLTKLQLTRYQGNILKGNAEFGVGTVKMAEIKSRLGGADCKTLATRRGYTGIIDKDIKYEDTWGIGGTCYVPYTGEPETATQREQRIQREQEIQTAQNAAYNYKWLSPNQCGKNKSSEPGCTWIVFRADRYSCGNAGTGSEGKICCRVNKNCSSPSTNPTDPVEPPSVAPTTPVKETKKIKKQNIASKQDCQNAADAIIAEFPDKRSLVSVTYRTETKMCKIDYDEIVGYK